MLQQPEADDYVLATGETHTVREFADLAFKELDMELEWEGEGPSEVGRIKEKVKRIKEEDLEAGSVVVAVDPKYYRPTEVDLLIGDATKAREKLGWEPKVKFEELVKIMAQADWEKVRRRGF